MQSISEERNETDLIERNEEKKEEDEQISAEKSKEDLFEQKEEE